MRLPASERLRWALLVGAAGLHGWWEAMQAQAPNAPLAPALSSLLYLARAGAMEGFRVIGGFMVLLGLAIYGIGERLVGPRRGALAGLAAMTAPGVLAFTHVYIFALPSAALLACGVYALPRGEGLRRCPGHSPAGRAGADAADADDGFRLIQTLTLPYRRLLRVWSRLT